jgi:hypothetical protein
VSNNNTVITNIKYIYLFVYFVKKSHKIYIPICIFRQKNVGSVKYGVTHPPPVPPPFRGILGFSFEVGGTFI